MSTESKPRRLAGLAGAVALGLVLLVAAGAKVLHPAALARQIEAEGLDLLLPARGLAVLVLAVEAGLGAALVMGVRHLAARVPVTLLSVAFLGLTGRTYARALAGAAPEDAGCGCFGYLVERTPAEAFWGDLALLGIPLALLWWGSWRRPPGGLPRRRLAIALLLGLGTGVLAWRAPGLDVDDWATRLGVGTRLAELCAGRDPRVCLTEAVPALEEGSHWVVLSGVGPELRAATPALNQAVWDGVTDGEIWILTTAEQGDIDRFRWSAGPAYRLQGDLPPALLRPLYRTLPRAFLVRDGRVVETVAGWPPWMEGDSP